MSLPPSFATVEVRGHYVDLGGLPVGGKVTFTATALAMNAGDDLTTVIGKPLVAILDEEGAFAVQLPATDDPDIDPTGFTYRVDEKFTGLSGRTFQMNVPIALQDVGIDLALVAPVAAAAGTARPFRLAELGDINLSGAVTGSILRRTSAGTWAAVVLPFATTADLAQLVRLEQLAAAPEQIIVGAIERDVDGAALSAGVVWPDGTPGTYEATVVSEAHPGAVDAYSVTYGSPVERTYVQPSVTRNTDGAVIFRPAIEVT